MNSRQYERQQLDHLQQVLDAVGIKEYKNCVLSADRTEYEITLPNGAVMIVPSGFDYFED
jgi:hypothetical protein